MRRQVTFLALALLSGGCGKLTLSGKLEAIGTTKLANEAKNWIVDSATLSALSGYWAQKTLCTPAANGRAGYWSFIYFNGPQYSEIREYYDNTQCAGAALALIDASGTAEVRSEPDSSRKSLRITYASTTAYPLTAQGEFAFSSYQECGITSWRANQPQAISGQTCLGGTYWPVAGESGYFELRFANTREVIIENDAFAKQ